jgi:hypothetical protein
MSRWKDDIKIYVKRIRMGVWIGFIWLGIGISGGSCEHRNEYSGSIKEEQFFG